MAGGKNRIGTLVCVPQEPVIVTSPGSCLQLAPKLALFLLLRLTPLGLAEDPAFAEGRTGSAWTLPSSPLAERTLRQRPALAMGPVFT